MTPANVPRDAIDPIVYIGFTWRVCCGEVEERFKDGTLAIHAVFDPSATRNPAAMGRALRQPKAQPLWIRAGTEPLRELGIEPPPHIEAVAAFPVDVVLAAVGFRIARTSTGEPPSTAAVLVAAVPGDLARWR